MTNARTCLSAIQAYLDANRDRYEQWLVDNGQ